MVRDPRGDLVEASVHLLCILLDYIPPSDFTRRLQQQQAPPTNPAQRATSSVMQENGMGNLFCSFLSRLHQNEVRNLMNFYGGKPGNKYIQNIYMAAVVNTKVLLFMNF